jgi:hypothetical protein
MPSTFTTSLRLVKQATGENSETWGDIFNQQFADLIDAAIAGRASISLSDADKTLTAANGAVDESRQMFLNFTGALTADRDIIVPPTSKIYFVRNSTSGGFALTVKTALGTGIAVPSGTAMGLMCDGTNVLELVSNLVSNTSINGNLVGYRGIPQKSVSADYTLVLGDAGFHIYRPSSDSVSRTWTIPNNTNVAFPVGTVVTFVNDGSAGALFIATESPDTTVLSGTGAVGSRTIIATGVATALKVAPTRWIISGTGIS